MVTALIEITVLMLHTATVVPSLLEYSLHLSPSYHFYSCPFCGGFLFYFFKSMRQIICPPCSQLHHPNYFTPFTKKTENKTQNNNSRKILFLLKLMPFALVTNNCSPFCLFYLDLLFILLINRRISFINHSISLHPYSCLHSHDFNI